MSMDRTELRDSARKAFGASSATGDAAGNWAKLSEMGWFMMTVPEAQGGLGLGSEAHAIIHYELGRALVPGPVIAQMMLVEALAATGQSDLLDRAMAGGKMTASLALPTEDDVIAAVPDADVASHVLVTRQGAIRVVPLDRCTIAAQPTWDETRRLFDVRPPSASDGVVIAHGEAAEQLRTSLLLQMLLALSADSLGGAEAALAMTVDYLKTRRQFDRPLAMFQALKHRVADLKIAHSAAEALLWDRAAGRPSLALMGSLKTHCTEAFRLIAEDCIQLHGGIGLTQEHPCHLFFKRAMLNCALGGDAFHWEDIAGRAVMETTG
ncbi:acyl-CoA dehydrogenase family protein [Blastomonas fulva]|uniref:acyl-CoA dehydrogenase family protein n=1 Tax=Blastomonas fulva TaxID=1550728 RepID=UPI003F72479A